MLAILTTDIETRLKSYVLFIVSAQVISSLPRLLTFEGFVVGEEHVIEYRPFLIK